MSIKGYKAFGKGMKCKDKQYKENTTYKESGTQICGNGVMHFCKEPFDVLNYYPLVNEDGEITEFAEVEAVGDIYEYNDKSATNKLHIGAKLNLKGFIKACIDFTIEKTKVETVKVYMGEISFDGSLIPLKNKDKLIDEDIVVNGKNYRASSILVGVPHTVIFVDDENYDVTEGKYIEKYELFEEGTNVNFVKVIDDENILVKTWERGAGATYSCGTGCSASVVICNKLNLTKDKVNVRVPGGQLRIELEGTSIYMIGDAEFICSGKAY